MTQTTLTLLLILSIAFAAAGLIGFGIWAILKLDAITAALSALQGDISDEAKI